MWTRFFKYTKRITESEYDRYYQSFRERQSELDTQLALLQEAEDTYYLSAKYLLELAQKAHQLFEVAEIDERRQLIKLVLSNLRLEGRKLRYEAIKPFKTILDFSDCQQWLAAWDEFRTALWSNYIPHPSVYMSQVSEVTQALYY